MWVSTNETFNNAPMLFQFSQKNNFCIFNFTNMKQLYSKEIHESLFSSIYSSANKIEVDVKNVIEYMKKIGEMKNVNYNFYQDNLSIKADLIITLSEGFPPFKLELELELKDENIFYSKLTCPLLKIIKQLKQNQEDLFDIIKKKDLEISEYKLVGGNISNENIKTEIFEKDNFFMNSLQNHKDLVEEIPYLYEVYSSLIEQYNIIRHPDVNKESNSISTKEENQKIQTKSIINNSIDHKTIKSSTTMEITNTSINVKKRKNSSLLKSL
ncbi:uncharacterized protein LOC114127203 [Aphis gossypii]|uniref:Non-homologous end-joining factor 1 n=1 Tax=Aphis gossypii TaxID=80765 RepID=A0A9P0NBS2_APHGO|nr:uncharacterized protein LOC114127203 [Aphis gossypii]XP_027847184.2 uncharacterized protein LOC114127203 [Aphis gossypii]XP_050066942.1 uncharacterized protein LOC114127203 [Aphis gossypii]XP_050066943.1 uncharacterized protein LOC114127203 [Aphis gossypii]XP_050066944.1 uncharacterized protein LOC114127203 [Aphis gossypii]XP_050066945.1 uncharacterized protein LOC114127203 [Aphis gossypii]CAH1715597.1 unnamed protein product [Aphis gossypii]